jgi:putative NADH-flavin reductase
MKIALFGASGRTGKELMIQSLVKGYDVVALARSPESIDLRDTKLSLVQGDVRDPDAAEKVIDGADVVLSALGNRSLKEGDLMETATRNMIAAMIKHGVKRIIVESSAGIFGAKDSSIFFGYVIRPLLLKKVFEDKLKQLNLLQESPLDWILVRPAGLIDAQKTGKYHITSDKPAGKKISRSDVADFMLRQVNSDQYLKQMPIISY